MNHFETEIEQYYRKLRNGITVTKVSRKGQLRDLRLYVSQDSKYIQWHSKLLGPKLGRLNKVSAENILRLEKVHTRSYLNLKGCDSDVNPLSIFYSSENGDKTLGLLIRSTNNYAAIETVLESIVNRVKQQRDNLTPDMLFLREMWRRADVDDDNKLTEYEIINLLSSINLNMPTSTIRKMFKEFDHDGNKSLDFDEFQELVHTLTRRPEIELIWYHMLNNTYFGGDINMIEMNVGNIEQQQLIEKSLKRMITIPQFIRLWQKYQGEKISKVEIWRRVKVYMSGVAIHPEDLKISFPLFQDFITHHFNDLYDPMKLTTYQDMNKPLTHYYIASSHNTYLDGDQLTSNSSVHRYVDDLMNGCRCVELDCWNGDDGEPVITHGHTMTSKIRFKDVIYAINLHAFKSSPYPVILSIENHCDVSQQDKLAIIMKTIFNEKLYTPSVDFAMKTNFPSPEELKYKILIKGKKSSKLMNVASIRRTASPFISIEQSDALTELTTDTPIEGKQAKLRENRQASSLSWDHVSAHRHNSTISSMNHHANQSSSSSTSSSSRIHQNTIGCCFPVTSSSKSMMLEDVMNPRSSFNLTKSDSHFQMENPRHSERLSTGGGPPFSERLSMGINGSSPLYDSHNPRLSTGSSPKSPPRISHSGIKSLRLTQRSNKSNNDNTDIDDDDDDINSPSEKHTDRNSSSLLSEITVLTGSSIKSFGSYYESFSLPCGTCSSFSENRMNKFIKSVDTVIGWIYYNQKNFSRVYPAGLRVDSSNLNPTEAWAAGCQLVALNYQTSDISMRLNHGKFRENGNCGYVLKPENLCAYPLISPPTGVILTVHLISGSQLPKPKGARKGEIIDPFVNMAIHGIQADCVSYKSRTINDNGFNPIWNEKFIFNISRPEIANLTIEVYDEDIGLFQDFVAYTTIPITCIRSGVRSCMLFDEKGRHDNDFQFASLLVYISIQSVAVSELPPSPGKATSSHRLFK